MRGHFWLVPILGGLLLLATDRNVSAQSTTEGYVRLQGPSHTPAEVFDPSVRQSGWAPPLRSPHAGSAAGPITAQGMSALSTSPPGASALPGNFQAWPGISPFDHQFSEHYVDRDGLWKWRGYSNRGRKYFFGIEYIRTDIKEPKRRRIGAPGIDTVSPEIIQPFTPPSPGVQTGGGGNQNNGDPARPYFDITFAAKDTRSAFLDESLPGVRLRWGFMDPQDQGFEAIVWWTQNLEQSKRIGLSTASNTNFTSARILNPGLPVLDDTPNGINIIYDFGTRYVWKQKAYGGNLGWIFSPIVRRGSFIVQPTFGARILRLQEYFSMTGRGSGLDYTDDIVTFPTNGGGGGGGGNNNNPSFNPDIGPDPGTVFPDPDTPPFTGFIQSDVRSLLAGPEAGIRYQVGGKQFKLLGSTKFGLAANHEIIKLSGKGIGSPQNLFTRFGPTSPNPDPFKLFDQERTFKDEQEHTVISPMLEQTVTAEINLFRMIPVIRNMRIFKNAHFRTGYTFQIFWNVARPTDSIIYRGQPLDPKIRVDRSSIWIGNWNNSVEWIY